MGGAAMGGAAIAGPAIGGAGRGSPGVGFVLDETRGDCSGEISFNEGSVVVGLSTGGYACGGSIQRSCPERSSLGAVAQTITHIHPADHTARRILANDVRLLANELRTHRAIV